MQPSSIVCWHCIDTLQCMTSTEGLLEHVPEHLTLNTPGETLEPAKHES